MIAGKTSAFPDQMKILSIDLLISFLSISCISDSSKAKSMTAAQRKSAVKRKRAKAQGVGGKPTNVRTFVKKRKRKTTKRKK